MLWENSLNEVFYEVLAKGDSSQEFKDCLLNFHNKYGTKLERKGNVSDNISFLTQYLEEFLIYMNDNLIKYSWTKYICAKFCELIIINRSIVINENDVNRSAEASAENKISAQDKKNVKNNDKGINNTYESGPEENKIEETQRGLTSNGNETGYKQGQNVHVQERRENTIDKFFQKKLNLDKILLLFKRLLLDKHTIDTEEWGYYDVYCLLGVLEKHFKNDCETFLHILQKIVFFMLTPSYKVYITSLSCKKRIRDLIYEGGEHLDELVRKPILRNSMKKNIPAIISDFSRDNDIKDSTLIKKITSILERVQKRIKKCLRKKNRDKNYGIRYVNRLLKYVSNNKNLFQDGSKLDIEIETVLVLLGTAVFEKNEFTPDPTQYLSYLLLLFLFNRDCILTYSAIKEKQCRLLEVKTGEGKSCIISMTAATYALMGRSVDIVTNSTELAKRDYEKWEPFYELLGLSVSCNSLLDCNKDCHEKNKDCYEKNIVYGTVGDFSRDILQANFLFKSIRRNRQHDIVLIDEVDSLMIDQGTEYTYLDDNFSKIGLNHVEPFLSLIWYRVQQFDLVKDKFSELVYYYGPVKPLFNIVLDHYSMFSSCGTSLELLGTNSRNRRRFSRLVRKYFCERKLSCSNDENAVIDFFNEAQEFLNKPIKLYKLFEDSTISKFFEQDKKTEVSNESPVLVLVLDDGMASILTSESQLEKDLLKQFEFYVGTSMIHRDALCMYKMPGFVKSFITKTRITDWIKSALCAMRATENREYVVKNGTAIYPVDFLSTGVVEVNKKWSNGMQQFLEMKHLLPLTPMQCINNYMSNIKLFGKYACLLGVSGTLPSKTLLQNGEEFKKDEELKFLEEYYDIRPTECYSIPRSFKHIFFEYNGLLLGCEAEWIAAIEARTATELAFGRSVLILCEDIDTAKKLEKAETNSYCRNDLITETQNIAKEISKKKIIISTNLGSRGTDYHIASDLSQAGGLFVIVTFLPRNERVQHQAFGRTARQGKCGSAQLILNRQNLPNYLKTCKTIDEIKEKRKFLVENNMISSINDLKKHIIKEELLEVFLKQQEVIMAEFVITTQIDAVTAAILNILRQKCAIWIERETSTEHPLPLDTLKAKLNEFINKEKIDTTFDDNFYYALSYTDAKLLKCKSGDYLILEDIKCYYTGIEKNFPNWSSFALHNRAFLNKKISSTLKDNNTIENDDIIVKDLKNAVQNMVFYKSELLFTYILVLLSQHQFNEGTVPQFTQWMLNRFLTLSHFEQCIKQNIKNFEEGNKKGEFFDNEKISELYQNYKMKGLNMNNDNVNTENILLVNMSYIIVTEILEFNKNKPLIIRAHNVKDVIRRVIKSVFSREFFCDTSKVEENKLFMLVWKTVSDCLLYCYPTMTNQLIKRGFDYDETMLIKLTEQIIQKLFCVHRFIQVKASVLNDLNSSMTEMTKAFILELENKNTELSKEFATLLSEQDDDKKFSCLSNELEKFSSQMSADKVIFKSVLILNKSVILRSIQDENVEKNLAIVYKKWVANNAVIVQSEANWLEVDNIIYINVNKMLKTDEINIKMQKMYIQKHILAFLVQKLNTASNEDSVREEICKNVIILPCLQRSVKFLSITLKDRLQMANRKAQLRKQHIYHEKLSEVYQKQIDEELLNVMLFATVFWLQVIILDINYKVKFVVNHDLYKQKIIIIDESTSKSQRKYKLVINGRYDNQKTTDNILFLLCASVNNLLKNDQSLKNFYDLALPHNIETVDSTNVSKCISEKMDSDNVKYGKIIRDYNFVKYKREILNLDALPGEAIHISSEIIQQKLTYVSTNLLKQCSLKIILLMSSQLGFF